MLINLNIDSYIEGFDFSQMSCIDIPIAGATGYFDYNYYYFFCMYKAWAENWGTDRLKFIEDKNQILNKMGLMLNEIKIEKDEYLFETIKHYIDQGIPLIYVVKYAALPYTYDYLINSTLTHALLISGYDLNKKVLVLKDTKVIDTDIHSEIANYFKANPLFTIYYKLEHFMSIWKENNVYLTSEKSDHIQKLYTMEKFTNFVKITNNDVIFDLFNNFNTKDDNLLRLIVDFNQNHYEITRNNRPVWAFQRALYGNLHAFFEGFEKCFEIGGLKLNNEYQIFKNEYMKCRSHILAILFAYALRGKRVPDVEIDKYIRITREANQNLENKLHDWCKELIQSSERNLVNYSKIAFISADSEYILDQNKFSANRVCNGQTMEWMNDSWVSNEQNIQHWLLFSLNEKIVLKYIKIIHSTFKGYATKHYDLLASNDMVKWDLIATRTNNNSSVTIDKANTCAYKYYKINVLEPNFLEIDFHARITEVELWGEANQ